MTLVTLQSRLLRFRLQILISLQLFIELVQEINQLLIIQRSILFDSDA
jgi:hypothetical protein